MNSTEKQAGIASIMTGLMLSLLLAALDSSIVGTAMPKIISDLHGLDYYSLPFTSYLLFSTVIIPIAGKLSDAFGRKLVIQWGMIFFLIMSFLCGFSVNIFMLTIFRGLQGACGGVLASSAVIITSELFPQKERGKYIGILASMYGLANLLGPVAGGVIADSLSWRWVFYINIPLGFIAYIFIAKNLPEMKHQENTKRIDTKGISLFLLIMFPFLFCFTEAGKLFEWDSPVTIILVLFSIIMFVWFQSAEKKSESPLLPVKLLGNKIFQKSAISAFMIYFALFGIILYVPYFMQMILKKGAAYTGMLMLPMCLSMTLGGIVGGILISKLQKFRLLGVIGFLLAIVGMSMIYLFGENISITALIICLIFTGYGMGSNFPLINIAPQSVFSESELGMVVSNIEFFQIMGGVISTAILGNVMRFSLISVLPISILSLVIGLISVSMFEEEKIKHGFNSNVNSELIEVQ